MKTEIDQYHPCKEAVEFRNKFKTFKEAWQACERGDWMLWIAKRAGVDLQPLTLAKALCAKTVIHLMNDERSRNAVEVAERFGRGQATREELDADADAYAAYAAYAAAADAATAYAAYAAYAAAAADAAAVAAVAATAYADYAAAAAADAAERKHTLKQCADICREVLTDEILKLIENDPK